MAGLPDAMAQMGGWFRATGAFTHLQGDDVASAVTTQNGGFMTGIDRPLGDHVIAGLAAGYSHTNLSQHDGETGSLDTPRVSIYGSYAAGNWALDATAGYAHERIHTGEKPCAC